MKDETSHVLIAKILFTIFGKAIKLLSGTWISKLPLVMKPYKLFYQYLKPKGIVLVSVGHHKMFVDTQADAAVSSSLIMNGYWEKCETDLFEKIIRPGMVVVDVGAHIGYYTLIAADLVGENGKVFAFEPDPDNYCLLVKNIELNRYCNITPVNKAISNQTGKMKLFTHRGNRSSSRLYDSHFCKEFTEVDVTTLDEFFKDYEAKINIIKIDIEGGGK